MRRAGARRHTRQGSPLSQPVVHSRHDGAGSGQRLPDPICTGPSSALTPSPSSSLPDVGTQPDVSANDALLQPLVQPQPLVLDDIDPEPGLPAPFDVASVVSPAFDLAAFEEWEEVRSALPHPTDARQ
jgi:hypothetical protein